MRAKRHRLGILRTERLDDLRPEDARCTHLGDFHEVVFADRPEERQALCKSIDGKPRLDARANVLKTVSKRVAELDICRRTRFLHVITRNGNAVELRHVLRRILEDIADDTHRHIRRIDVRVSHHEFLQDIVLNRACHDLLVDAPAPHRTG